MVKSSQYYLGSIDTYHKKKRILVGAGAPGFDSIGESLIDYDIAYVINGYEHRPDLISDVFYNTPEYWWLILLYNNIDDPFEGLNVGDQIKVPKI